MVYKCNRKQSENCALDFLPPQPFWEMKLAMGWNNLSVLTDGSDLWGKEGTASVLFGTFVLDFP